MATIPHQYIARHSGEVRSERLLGDAIVRLLYARWREEPSLMFRMLVSRRASALLAGLNCDSRVTGLLFGAMRFMQANGMDPDECLEPPERLNTARKIFERKIRYWESRPMPDQNEAIVSPADARVLVGSFRDASQVFIKGKYFDLEELFGLNGARWVGHYADGDFALFRLTPDKYHYNHVPVSGRVLDFYETGGAYHSCKPSATVAVVTPLSKNARTVTVIDTDVPGGTGAGLVAMIEVVALMIGRIRQCYSEDKYIDPKPVATGMFIRKGSPKSLYSPGSSTDLVLFQSRRVRFDEDIVTNMFRAGVQSRFSQGLGQPLVETEVQVRSQIGVALASAAGA